MTNANDARKAHKILDDLFKGNMVLDEERKFLRRALPELPKQKTLEEIHEEVDEAWLATNDPGLKERLCEISTQIKGLFYSAPNSPALPAGMRLADHEQYGRVITSPKPNRDGVYDLLVPRPKFETGADWDYAHECELTFIDAEPAKPAHPEFLETEADYSNAPEGTVVARDNGLPWVKEKSNYWTRPDTAKSDYGMSLGSRRVLRWGNE